MLDLVGPSSPFFFIAFDIDSGFLSEPVKSLKTNTIFQTSNEVVKHLKVINDLAERGVKLTAGFLGSAHKEENFQNILQLLK